MRGAGVALVTVGVIAVAAIAAGARTAWLHHRFIRQTADEREQLRILREVMRRADEPAPPPPSPAPAGFSGAPPNRVPDFGLVAADGRGLVAIADFRGGPVAVVAWSAMLREDEVEALARLGRELAVRGVNLVGVAPDEPPVLRQRIAAAALAFPTGALAQPDLLYRLGADQLPRVVLVDKRGVMVEPFPVATVPMASVVLERFASRYEELGDAALARLRRTFPAATRLAPVSVEGRFVGWFRVLDAADATLGFAKYVERDRRCPGCDVARVVVCVGPDGVVAGVELLEALAVGTRLLDPAALAAQLGEGGAHEHVRLMPPAGARATAPPALTGTSPGVGEVARAFDLDREWPRLDRDRPPPSLADDGPSPFPPVEERPR